MSTDQNALREDHLFGLLAVREGFLVQEEIDRGLGRQKALWARGSKKRLPAILMEEGLITADQTRRLLEKQRRSLVSCNGCPAVFNVANLEPGVRFVCKRCKSVVTVPFPDGSPSMHPTMAVKEMAPEPDAESDRGGLSDRVLGGCRVHSRIGQGGMGAVYKAVQISLNRTVAVKVLPEVLTDNREYITRFEREARIIAGLSHANIVQVFDMGKDRESGLYYIVMEFLEGGSVGGQLDGPMDVDVAVRYVIEAADGLYAAHKQRILHRDVKPDNLLLDREHRVKIADFGLARGVESTVKLTGTGAALGTPAFMAPEQGMGETVDHRADLYSLGASLFTLLTAEYVFQAESPISMLVKHSQEPVPSVRERAPHVSRAIEEFLYKALDKEPSRRFQDAREFAEALRRAHADGDGSASPTRPQKRREAPVKPARKASARRPAVKSGRKPRTPGLPGTKRPGAGKPSSPNHGAGMLALGFGGGAFFLALIGLVLFFALSGSGSNASKGGSRERGEPSTRDESSHGSKEPSGKSDGGNGPSPTPGPTEDPGPDPLTQSLLDGGYIERNLSVRRGEYTIKADVEILESARMEVEAGTVFRMAPGSGFAVRGRLVTKGTKKDPVVFLPENPQQGWKNIAFIGDGTEGSVMEYAVIRGGRGRTFPTITWTSKADGLDIHQDACGGGVAVVLGGDVRLVSCRVVSCETAFCGGAVFSHTGVVRIDGGMFAKNNAPYAGGGFHANGGTFLCDNAVVKDNSSRHAAGFHILGLVTFTCTNTRFEGNTALEHIGGGTIQGRASMVARNCVFQGNVGKRCGGLRLSECEATLIECQFRGNRSNNEAGGAIRAIKSNVILNGCRFWENSSLVSEGGAMYIHECEKIKMTDCSFLGNKAARGGAIFTENSLVECDKCEFRQNRSKRGGAILWQARKPILGASTSFDRNAPNDVEEYE